MQTQQDLPFSHYVSQVARYPKLSREQEAELCRLWKEYGAKQARNELARANLRYVVVIARRYRRYGLPLSDLVSEGNLGLLHAIDKFEPERGLRFLTYAAYWIRANILSTVCRSWSLVHVGSVSLRSKLFFKLRRERARVVNLLGDSDAAVEVLSANFGVPRSQMDDMLQRLEVRDLSLDRPLTPDTTTSHVDMLVSPVFDQEQFYVHQESQQQAHTAIHLALRALDARERFVIEAHVMKDAEDQLSLAEMGRRLGVSRERVRQLEIRAIQKLRARIVANAGGDLGGACLGSAA